MVHRNGKIRTINLRPEQDESLNALCLETGMNRNQLIKTVVTRLTADEVAELADRDPIERD